MYIKPEITVMTKNQMMEAMEVQAKCNGYIGCGRNFGICIYGYEPGCHPAYLMPC